MPEYTTNAYLPLPATGQDTLPPADIQRWLTAHKVQVIHAVRAGIITLEEACQRYALSVEEFIQWQTLADRQAYPVRRSSTTRLSLR